MLKGIIAYVKISAVMGSCFGKINGARKGDKKL
jgi:hypothetical protein